MSLNLTHWNPRIPFTRAQRNILQKWSQEQLTLKSQLKLIDDTLKQKPRFIAGVDVSFFLNSDRAVASLVIVKVLRDGTIRTVYEGYDARVKMTEPYIPGFLAFRELKPLLGLFEKLKRTHPEYWPDVVIVDGNGYLHPRGFGLASHLGVKLDVPTIGVAKRLLFVPNMGIRRSDNSKVRRWMQSAKPLETLPLGRVDGKPVTAAMKVGNTSDAVFISQGHRVSLEMAVRVVRLVGCERDTCEVVRLADRKSRDLIKRVNWQKEWENACRN